MIQRSDLDDFLSAIYGVAAGVAIAALLACALWPSAGDYGDPSVLGHAHGWARQESREKAYWALALLLGGVGGWTAIRFALVYNGPLVVRAALLLTLVPSYDATIGRGLANPETSAWIWPLLAFAHVALLASSIRYLPVPRSTPLITTLPPPPLNSRQTWVFDVLAILTLCVVLLPLDAEWIAAWIGFEPHPVSFIIGPGLYSAYADGLVPGLDYFSQYSVGLPYIFSFYMGETADETVIRFVHVLVGLTLFFHLTLYVFLRWFLDSALWALIVTALAAILLFHFDQPLGDPSSYPARYPLLAVFTTLFCWWVAMPSSWSRTLCLALCLALSVFLNTETGAHGAIAFCVATLFIFGTLQQALTSILRIGALSFALFLTVSFIAFGAKALTPAFIFGLIEPLLLYSSGLGAESIAFSPGLTYFYHWIAPGLALASVSYAAYSLRTKPSSVDVLRCAGLMLVSLLGLLMSLKFINRSITGVWLVSASPFLIVTAFWIQRVLRLVFAQIVDAHQRRLLHISTGTGLTLICFVLLWHIEDPRNPTQYAMQSYIHYPSLLNSMLHSPRKQCQAMSCSTPRIAPEDIALIRSQTKPGARVHVFHPYDWAFLVEAKRASAFHFLPSPSLFTKHQLQRSLESVDLIFLPNDADYEFGIAHDGVRRALSQDLRENFELIGRGAELVAWRQGYADGIDVISATYGGNCTDFEPVRPAVNAVRSGNAVTALKDTCAGKSRCAFFIDVNRLSDPASGCEKDFSVIYRCLSHGVTKETSVAAEAHGEIVTLECGAEH